MFAHSPIPVEIYFLNMPHFKLLGIHCICQNRKSVYKKYLRWLLFMLIFKIKFACSWFEFALWIVLQAFRFLFQVIHHCRTLSVTYFYCSINSLCCNIFLFRLFYYQLLFLNISSQMFINALKHNASSDLYLHRHWYFWICDITKKIFERVW